MEKKNIEIGTMLGFSIIGLPYAGGVLKGIIAAVILLAIGQVLYIFTGGSGFYFVVNFIGAFLGYTWTNAYNKAIDDEQVR